MAEPAAPQAVRLAELLAVLSLGTDLGLGQPMEHVLRQCLIALRLAGPAGLDAEDREALYYGSLLAWVGCHVDAYEQAKWFGDDMALKRDYRLTDFAAPTAGPLYLLRHVGAGRPVHERLQAGAGFLHDGMRAAGAMLENHWRAAAGLIEQLGLGQRVRDTVRQSFERWDGKGPGAQRGEALLVTSRLVTLADVVEVFHRLDGVDAAVAVARQRSGTQFDPALVDLFAAEAPSLFADLDAARSWDAVIAAEPVLQAGLADQDLDTALGAIADFVDVKSPYTIGHSRGVADLARGAAPAWGLSEADGTLLWRSALLHDLGRLGVSNAIWDKRGQLTASEVERVRLHVYLTERMLASSPALAPLAAIAAQHHERLDGSGYPRGLAGDAITPSGRLLAAADAYHARLEPRPHRPARAPDEAAGDLREEVRAGRLDGGAVEAVLQTAGHPAGARRELPAGLTVREVDVLRLLARGLATKQIARQLEISPRTAGAHIEHIYAKAGVTNRALASLFAARHGLMG